VYGLGQRAAPLNLRGGTYQLWNQDPGGSYGPGDDPLYMTMPTYYGLHGAGGYMVFYENSHPGSLHLKDEAEVRFEGGALQYYFIPGTPRQALKQFSELTGRPPMPPRWALGFHQSRWGYRTGAEVQEIVAGFEGHDLPLSALHLDIDYMDGYRVFTVNEDRFPDIANLTADLARRGVRTVMILDPGVKKDQSYAFYREGLEGNRFLNDQNGTPFHGLVWPGWSAFPDFTDSDVRSWWGSGYQRLVDRGVDGFWHDMNEPTSFAAWGQPTLPQALGHHMEGRGGVHQEAHNVYGLLMNRAGFEALRKVRPDHRPWLLTRSGWVGVQRYAWHWTGDIESTWEALRQTIPTVLGLALSGIPYTGPDIGGFSGSPSEELFTRWFQVAAFMPFFRNHAAIHTTPREPWAFDSLYLDVMRSYLRLRYRLMPYFYTLAWVAHQTGAPLLRPLFWHEPDNRHLWDVQDAFFLGDSILVAPALSEGMTAREVNLPSGGWYHVWDDRYFEGPQTIELPVSLAEIPLLVGAGSVIPMEIEDKLQLHIYAPQKGLGEGGGSLYSDAGDGYGEWRLDRFRTSHTGDTLELAWDQEGESLFPYKQIELHLHGIEAHSAIMNGEEIPVEENRLSVGYFERLTFNLRA
jgi:alpha-glucosidase